MREIEDLGAGFLGARGNRGVLKEEAINNDRIRLMMLTANHQDSQTLLLWEPQPVPRLDELQMKAVSHGLICSENRNPSQFGQFLNVQNDTIFIARTDANW